MSWLLNGVYLLLLILFLPILGYRAIRYQKYRKNFGTRFWGIAPKLPEKKPGGVRLWFQAVSVGEVNLLKPIFWQIANLHPDWELVISSTSKTGLELAKRTFPDHVVFPCPLDFHWAVRRAMRRIQPDLLVLAELELWPNLIAAAKKSGARVAIVNGRISDKSFPKYRRIRPLLRRVFRSVELVAAQDAESAARFLAVGAADDSLKITGSIKFDGVATDRNNPKTTALAALAGIVPDDLVFLAGSTQEPEEALAVETFRTLAPDFPRLRLIVVPRHPERFDAVAGMLDASGLSWTRRSTLNGEPPKERILLVDTVGELGAWWGTAHIAFVGGSMGSRGGQNVLEPAGYGAAVSFGPNTKNFRDITAMMLRANAAVVVADGNELTAFVRRALSEPLFAERLGQNAQNLVLAQCGATRVTVSYLAALLRNESFKDSFFYANGENTTAR